jgi:hypothetical protein
MIAVYFSAQEEDLSFMAFSLPFLIEGCFFIQFN